ncbi:MAG: DUF4349 domain-containing protein [Gemmatimonadales bacterium]
MRSSIAAAVAVALVIACQQANGPASQAYRLADERPLASTEGEARPDLAARVSTGAVASAPELGLMLPSATDVLPNLVIRTGTATIEVDSLERAIALTRALAHRVGGFVAGSAAQAGKGQLHSASLEIRMPADRFDDAVDGLRPLGKVEAVNVSAQDVGEEYVDVEARVTNARRLEARLIDLLTRRTGKLADVLQVEHELARVREEIERYEGRLRYLRSRAAVSTLTLTIHEPIPVVDNGSPGVVAEAVRQAWRNFIGLVALTIQSLGVILPLGLVAAAGWWIVRRFRKATPPRPATA